MKKMKRFLVALLSCLTAVACVAGISACKDEKPAEDNSANQTPSFDITVDLGGEDCAHDYQIKRLGKTTCEEDGYVALTCSKCGDIVDMEYKEATGHTKVPVEAVPATCTTDGAKAYTKCAVCDWTDGNEGVVKALGHTWSLKVSGLAKSCEDAGYTAFYYCTVCKADYDKANKEALMLEQDKFAEILADAGLTTQDDIDAFTSKYWNEYYYLSGKVATLGLEVIPASHNMVDVHKLDANEYEDVDAFKEDADGNYAIPVGATCLDDGLKSFKVCLDCANIADILAAGEEAAKKLENATPYDIVSAYVKAGLVVEGLEAIDAYELGAHTSLKADGTSVYVEGKAATCTEAGYQWHYNCTRCEKDINMKDGKAIVIPALGHDIKDAEGEDKVATCTANVKCNVCGVEVVAMKAHKLVKVDAKAATCTENGWKNKAYCADCNYEEATTVYALGHDWKKVDYKDYKTVKCLTGTLTEADAGKYVECAKCDVWGKVYTDEVDEISSPTWAEGPAGHTVSDKYVAATCTAAAKNNKCTECGVYVNDDGEEITKAEATAKAAHTFEGEYDADPEDEDNDLIDAMEATCTEDAVCAVCGVLKDTALGHKDADGKSTWVAVEDYEEYVAPTCEAEGNLKAEYCTLCDDVRVYVDGKAVLEIKVYGDVTIDVGADGNVNEDVAILPAVGHDFKLDKNGEVVFVAAVAPTCTATGFAAYTKCLNCGAYFDEDLDEVDAEDLVIAKVAHAGTNEGNFCTYVCNASVWTDKDKDGVVDAGELSGCGCTLVNGDADARHNYKDGKCLTCNAEHTGHDFKDEVCTVCGKAKED